MFHILQLVLMAVGILFSASSAFLLRTNPSGLPDRLDLAASGFYARTGFVLVMLGNIILILRLLGPLS